MKVLIIEDHPYKLGQILSFLQDSYPKAIISVKNSYISGLKELILNGNSYDFLLLDISMPNYDITPEENGGDFLPFAGKLILKEMYLREIPTKAIVITMHGSFEDGTKLAELDESLTREFSENYVGYVYFSPISIGWKTQLEILINITNRNDSNPNS